jgi:hypothetical protein
MPRALSKTVRNAQLSCSKITIQNIRLAEKFYTTAEVPKYLPN